MEHVLSATEARVRFGELLQRVTEQHETVVVERGGVPQVVVMSMAEYQRLSAKQTPGGWRNLARAAHDEAMEELKSSPAHRPEDILAQAREERDARLARQVGDRGPSIRLVGETTAPRAPRASRPPRRRP